MKKTTVFGGALAAGALGAGLLVWGALVESNRLTVRRVRLPIPGWPTERAGYRIALLGDFHVRDDHSERLARRACETALGLGPDLVVLAGDHVGRWKPGAADRLLAALAPLAEADVPVVATTGNHDWDSGSPENLRPVFDALGVRFLRNEAIVLDGVTVVGVDSAREGEADLDRALRTAVAGPRILVWHEPDAVDTVAPGTVELMLSGHSHGGQFRLPGGITPMRCDMGKKYHDGWYGETPVPLFVTRGVGTTGPPSRFLCPPEVALLELVPHDFRSQIGDGGERAIV